MTDRFWTVRQGFMRSLAGILFTSGIGVFWSIGCSDSDTRSSSAVPAEAVGSTEQALNQVPPNGGVTTIAGKAATPGNIDSTIPANGRLNDPAAVAVATDGTIYVADWGNNAIRRIKPDGSLDTIAKGSPNVLVNPRFDAVVNGPMTPPGWTAQSGTWYAGGVSPFDGWAAANGNGALTQTYTLNTSQISAAAAGTLRVRFVVRAREVPTGTAHVVVEYLDGNGGAVATRYDSSDTRPPTNLSFWQQYSREIAPQRDEKDKSFVDVEHGRRRQL